MQFSRRTFLTGTLAALASRSFAASTSKEPIPVVFDNGSLFFKAGSPANPPPGSPKSIFPTIVGRPRHTGVMVGMGQKDAYVGKEALDKRDILALKFPIENGLVVDFDDLDKVWHHAFYNELHVAPENTSVLISEKPLNPKESRQKMINLLFETFNVQSLYVAPDACLALTAANLKTGLVLSLGGGATNITPVNQLTILEHAAARLELSGKTLTESLGKMISCPDDLFSNTMKETLCYVALDPQREKPIAKTYQTPQKTYTLTEERFKCPEAFFHPELADLKSHGIHTLIHEAIQKCDANLRSELYANILLEGGSSLFPGLPERLKKELESLTKEKITILAPPDRHLLAWHGGAALAAATTFRNAWITKSQYDQAGPAVVHRKDL